MESEKKQDTNELICKTEESLSFLNVFDQETIDDFTWHLMDTHAAPLCTTLVSNHAFSLHYTVFISYIIAKLSCLSSLKAT